MLLHICEEFTLHMISIPYCTDLSVGASVFLLILDGLVVSLNAIRLTFSVMLS
jgi:hypothetical protein